MTRETSDTPRRGYGRPALGSDWAGDWDTLVEDLDETLVARGPIADRPASGEYDDELYLATDEQTLYRWDGTSWVEALDAGTSFANSTSLTAGFGTWTTADADRPVQLFVAGRAATDGTTRGEVRIEIDESGGTSTDYSFIVAFADPSLGSNAVQGNGSTLPLGAGEQFRLVNASDPTEANSIETVRKRPIE